MTVLFNRQILKCLGTDALSVYGIIINVSTFVQCCAYSIGQAAQPMLSTNFGAGEGDRIRELQRYTLATAAAFALVWTAVCMAIPNGFVRVFMAPTDASLAIAPGIIRRYALSFLLLPLNIYSTYYFQALMKPGISLAVSVARGAVISGIFIFVLPALFGAGAIWFAMPLTELLVAVYVLEQGDYVISINSDSHTVLDFRTYTVDKTIRYTDGRASDDTAAANQFAFAKGDVTYLSRADGFANYVEATAAPATLVLADSYKDTFVNNLNYDPAAFNDPASINNNFTGMGSIGFPSAVMIAATWNTDLATRFGESIGKMADEMGVSGWYAPAMNVHRSVFAADVLLAALVLFLEWKTVKGYKKRKQ